MSEAQYKILEQMDELAAIRRGIISSAIHQLYWYALDNHELGTLAMIELPEIV